MALILHEPATTNLLTGDPTRVVAYIVMAYIVMAYIFMAYINKICIGIAERL